MSSGREGNSSGGAGRLSMKEVMLVEDDGSKEGRPIPILPLVEFESVNSKVEGTVEGASSCNSRLEVIREFHTSPLNAPSE